MLHKRLVKLRKSKKLTQVELAKALGVTRSALSQYELGLRNPDYDTLDKYSKYFGVSFDDLLGGYRKTEDSKEHSEFIIKEFVERYGIDLKSDTDRNKLEQLIKIVFEDVKGKEDKQ